MSLFPTPCRTSSCPQATTNDSGWCDTHEAEQPTYDDDRPTAAQRGYDSRWRKASKRYRRKHPLCERCKAKGKTREADLVHHKTPLNEGGSKYDPDNLESLCRWHHRDAHRKEKAG